MQGERIVDGVTDAPALQMILELVTPRYPNGVLMENVIVGPVDRRRANIGLSLESRRIARRVFLSGLGPSREVGQFGQQDSRLQGIQSTVGAHLFVVVLARSSMEPQPPEPLRQRVILGDHQAGVSPGAQVLGRKEREGSHGAQLSRGSPL